MAGVKKGEGGNKGRRRIVSPSADPPPTEATADAAPVVDEAAIAAEIAAANARRAAADPEPPADLPVLDVAQWDRYCKLPVERLALAEWNYKTDDPTMAEKLKNNLALHGQVQNLIVRELATGFFEVVNGNHRLKVLREMGVEHAVCFNLGVVSDARAKRIAIETNETNFASDHLLLAALLKEARAEFTPADLEATMPFSAEEMENFGRLADWNWPEDTGGEGGGDGDGEGAGDEVVTCPKCGHVFPT